MRYSYVAVNGWFRNSCLEFGSLLICTFCWTSHCKLLLKYDYSKKYYRDNIIDNQVNHMSPNLLYHILEKCIVRPYRGYELYFDLRYGSKNRHDIASDIVLSRHFKNNWSGNKAAGDYCISLFIYWTCFRQLTRD